MIKAGRQAIILVQYWACGHYTNTVPH